MPSTDADICNLALAHLGEAPITALTDDTTAGRACNRAYESTLKAVLRAHRWNFATKRDALTPEVTAPAFEWSYSYVLPADFLRCLEINGDELEQSNKWTIEGGKLLCNDSTVNLLYTAFIDDVTLFDPLFVEALTIKLAIALSEQIRGTTSRTEQLVTQYERIVAPLARRVDSNEGQRRKGLRPVNSLAIQSRLAGASPTWIRDY